MHVLVVTESKWCGLMLHASFCNLSNYLVHVRMPVLHMGNLSVSYRVSSRYCKRNDLEYFYNSLIDPLSVTHTFVGCRLLRQGCFECWLLQTCYRAYISVKVSRCRYRALRNVPAARALLRKYWIPCRKWQSLQILLFILSFLL